MLLYNINFSESNDFCVPVQFLYFLVYVPYVHILLCLKHLIGAGL